MKIHKMNKIHTYKKLKEFSFKHSWFIYTRLPWLPGIAWVLCNRVGRCVERVGVSDLLDPPYSTWNPHRGPGTVLVVSWISMDTDTRCIHR